MSKFNNKTTFLLIACLLIAANSFAGQWPKTLHVYKGQTPKIDGKIDKGEYDDATFFVMDDSWTAQFSPVNDPNDYSIKGWAKHDGENLYFAFDVTDDVLYGIDIPSWLPDENPNVHELTRQGYPWFGDGLELLINASYKWSREDGQNNSGDGSSWQMVCNTTKSRLGGVGKGGLLEGEERSNESAWNTYQKWIKNGDMKAVVKIKDEGKGYLVEWVIKPDPCLEIEPGKFWNPETPTVKMGFNIGTQDLDEKEKGAGNFGNFHHEQWWAGEKDKRTWLKQWGTLVLHSQKKPFEIYVDPNAKENGSGTKDKPFKTLEKARDLARTIDEHVNIYLIDGIYRLDKTFRLDQRDSNVAYKAYPGEKPILSGGKIISDWQRHKNGIWKAKVDFNFRQLYVNNKRAIRARYPNNDYFKIKNWNIKDNTILVPDLCIQQWSNFDDIEMIIQQVWAESILRLQSFESRANLAEITPQEPVRTLIFERPYPKKLNEQAFHFENAYEFLDQPGEWFLDDSNSIVYYKPLDGQDLKTETVVAPYIETLVCAKGTLDEPIKNLTLQGISFRHTTWMLPDKSGVLGLQAGIYNVKADAKNNQYGDRQKAAVYIAAAHNVKIKENIFTHTGACALDLHFATLECEIAGNVFTDVSGNGIQHAVFSEPTVEIHETYNPDDQREICRKDTIHNNYFDDIGVVYWGCVAIASGWPQELTILHNEITNTPYSGISVGWGWNKNKSVMRENKISYNYLHNVIQRLSDAGAIYTLSPQPGSEISYNYIHDVSPGKEVIHGFLKGLYFDECSNGFTVHHNVIYDAPYQIFTHRIGPNVIFHNNYTREKAWEFWGKGDNNYPGQSEDIKRRAGLEPYYLFIKKDF
jgi:hypothetical protein